MTKKEFEELGNFLYEKLNQQKGDEMMTTDEAAKYMGISAGYMYKLGGEIPHYKPRGKKCYYKKRDLDAYLQAVRISSRTEIEDRVKSECRQV